MSKTTDAEKVVRYWDKNDWDIDTLDEGDINCLIEGFEEVKTRMEEVEKLSEYRFSEWMNLRNAVIEASRTACGTYNEKRVSIDRKLFRIMRKLAMGDGK